MTARSVAAAGLAAAIAIAAAAGARAACTDETRSSLYQSFTASFRGDPSAQKQADDIAQRFLDDCARDDGPTLYVHRWHVLYVRATEAYQLAVALQQGRYPDALSLGADLIRRGDTDTPVMINLAVGGYRALAAKTAGVDLGAALRAAKIAIDALQRPD